MSKNKDKTNVMRILDQKKITYISHNYESTGAISGVEVAQALDQDPDMVFKTLVTRGKIKSKLCICRSGEKRAGSEKSGPRCRREEY